MVYSRELNFIFFELDLRGLPTIHQEATVS